MYTRDEIERMDFSRLVGVCNEPNMPSGGAATIMRVLEKVPLSHSANLLEVGSNTGFTSLELAYWTKARVVGIDLNRTSIAFAQEKASRFGLHNVQFLEANALHMPFPDGTFDLVFCSNVTSFIRDREQAVSEYYRVLKPQGVLAAVPIYYHSSPPESLREQVEQAIGAPLPVRGKEYWTKLFEHDAARLCVDEDYEFIFQTPERIDAYVQLVMDQPHLQVLPDDVQGAIARQLRYFYDLFNENLQYTRFSILLFQANAPNKVPMLFQTRRI